jgi:hypothetical protein
MLRYTTLHHTMLHTPHYTTPHHTALLCRFNLSHSQVAGAAEDLQLMTRENQAITSELAGQPPPSQPDGTEAASTSAK